MSSHILEKAKIASIKLILLNSQLSLTDHMSRLEDLRLPWTAPYGVLSTGRRDRGEPKKRYKDSLQEYFGACDVDYHK